MSEFKPKSWDDIAGDAGRIGFSSDRWVDLGGIRAYDGTAYVECDGGWIPCDDLVETLADVSDRLETLEELSGGPETLEKISDD